MSFIIDNLIVPITENPTPFIIAGVIIYILAKILVKFTSCTIVAGIPDFIILSILDLVIVVYFFVQNIEVLNVIFSIIFFVLLTVSVFLSIKSNWGILLPIYLVVSLVVKAILLILIPVCLLLMIGSIFTGVPDKRYKDGTKYNEYTEISNQISDLAEKLVFSLVREEK